MNHTNTVPEVLHSDLTFVTALNMTPNERTVQASMIRKDIS